jgi:hypothetical protein
MQRTMEPYFHIGPFRRSTRMIEAFLQRRSWGRVPAGSFGSCSALPAERRSGTAMPRARGRAASVCGVPGVYAESLTTGPRRTPECGPPGEFAITGDGLAATLAVAGFERRVGVGLAMRRLAQLSCQGDLPTPTGIARTVRPTLLIACRTGLQPAACNGLSSRKKRIFSTACFLLSLTAGRALGEQCAGRGA